MNKGNQAKWIFTHNSENQLGCIKENERINIGRQVKLLFQLWDADNSGSIGIEELVHGLISIGLGGSPEFTEEV